MSKDIIVLTPNGRRQKVHCNPDTSLLQVLEDVCEKQGFEATEYGLKHHNHILDLSTTIRFSNLPNKATLEIVELQRKREEANVTIGLLLEDGERRTADFSPNTSLYELVTSLAPTELSSYQSPTILYMRQEVVGVSALQGKTLRQLGLLQGRAILRLLNKVGESKQANVSAIYRCPPAETANPNKDTNTANDEFSAPGPSNSYKTGHTTFDPIKLIKEAKHAPTPAAHNQHEEGTEGKAAGDDRGPIIDTVNTETPMEIEPNQPVTKSSTSVISQENLERRLRIEDEVTFLGAQKAVAFMQPEDMEDEINDLPDDFYELTIEEVRKLYKDLQEHKLQMENSPLLTSNKREDIQSQKSTHRLGGYKNAVVRIQFPDHMILQGIFDPTNTIGDVTNFIKEHLKTPEKLFHIFTTPLKETLDPTLTLLEAKFVPCVHMHFKWREDDGGQPYYLKEDIYLKQTSSDAASILASKYRAPSRRKADDASDTSERSNVASSSTAKSSRVPKWFKT